MDAADYLYPLEQTGQQYVVNGHAATPEVLALEATLGEHSSFLLSVGQARVKPGDRIWFRAGAPAGRVVALGIVQAPPYQGSDDGRWRIVVALDAKASHLLQQSSAQPELRAVRQAVWAASEDEAAGLRKIVGQ